MESFPTLEALAAATEDQVMQDWQRLGDYSRARNLHKAAHYLCEHHNGEFPQALPELEKIPGVGRYTAGAIRSFAYNAYHPIVDGNVKRLFCRLFALKGLPNSTALTKELWQLAEQLTPTTNNRKFAQGLLDLGATLCKPKAPRCNECPFNSECKAFKLEQQALFPERKAKVKLPEKDAHFALYTKKTDQDSAILITKRPDIGLWRSLWCLPTMAQAPEAEPKPKVSFQHTFSHFKMRGHIWQQSTVHTQQLHENSETAWVTAAQLHEFGFPAPIIKELRKLLAAENK